MYSELLKFRRRFGALALGAACLVLTSAAANASTLTGSLDIANCSGQGVIVTATTISWLPGPSSGCIDTGSGTGVTYNGGSLGAGVQGSIQNLTGGLPVSNFMSFAGTPLNFTLTGLGPGSTDTNCGALTIGQSCSVAGGSPFFLLDLGNGSTAVVLTANGTVTDGTLTTTWSGSFSESLNLTAAAIQADILGGGSITGTTYQGAFDLTLGSSTPEPATWALSLLGLGLVAIGTAKRKTFSKAS
jgi:PEP-CTERM motif